MTRGDNRRLAMARAWAGTRSLMPATAAAVAIAVATVAATTTVTAPAGAAEFERTFTFKADELTVADLIGAVKVEPTDGSDFRVVVHVRGRDADEKLIRFEERAQGRASLAIQFPVDEHRDYVYPQMGNGGRSRFSIREDRDGFLSELLDLARGDRVEVRGRGWGNALELWADVTVQVPKGRDAHVLLGCGEITAARISGELELRTRIGAVAADGVEGNVLIDTGSGSVTVRSVRGDVDVDTGSGSVTLSNVQSKADVRVDTGSGSVRARDIEARLLFIDTGSGHVDLASISVEDLEVDTGSGGVEAADLAADDVRIDTGSGGVEVELVRMSKGRYDVDTGSGGIRLALPRELSAGFDCSTGSGSIIADIEGVSLSRRERRSARFTVGGGDADFRLSTGSGSIRLQQGAATARR